MSTRISIVTVVLNDAVGLRHTIESIKKQTYADIAHIIIDGGSTDDTVSVIREYGKSIRYWVSESDRGLYDAMNKGVLASNASSYICFMNAGDMFFSNTTIEDVVSVLGNNTPDVLYGDAEIYYSFGFKRVSSAVSLHDLWKGMCFSHQSMFVNSGIMRKKIYNQSNTIAADYECICDFYHSGYRFEYFGDIIAKITAGGVSDIKRVQSVRGHWHVANTFWPGWRTNFYYSLKIIDATIRAIAHKYLPPTVNSFLIKLKHCLSN